MLFAWVAMMLRSLQLVLLGMQGARSLILFLPFSRSSTGNLQKIPTISNLGEVKVPSFYYYSTKTSYLNMGWTETWDDILSGGFQRWKVLDAKAHEEAIFHLKRAIGDKTGASILCPLAGDDPVVNKLFKEGYAVTAIDLVPSALEAMRSQFEGEWSKLEAGDTVVWKHESGRATQYEGDMLKSRPELRGKFDAVYDKDSFGALSPELRSSYISRLAEYTLPGSALYVETKLKENHEQVKNEGPPFSFLPEEVQDQFSKFFSYSEYMGEIYQLALPNMKQTAHMLRRL